MMTKTKKNIGELYSLTQIDSIIFKGILQALIRDRFLNAKAKRDISPSAFAKKLHDATLDAIGDRGLKIDRPDFGVFEEIDDDVSFGALELIEGALELAEV